MRNAPKLLGALLLATLAGCAQHPAGQPIAYATLPGDAVVGAGDPTRAAIVSTAYVFGTPSAVAGRPDAAARAVAELEYLATEIPTGPRWREWDPTIAPQLVAARDEVRAALGIAPDAPPQAVVDTLFAASRALRQGDAAAAQRSLSAPFYANGAETLTRLASLPPLPAANVATSRAASELDKQRFWGRSGGADGGGGRP